MKIFGPLKTKNITMKTYKTAIIIAALAMLTSCFSPKPIMRFKPEETQTTWEKGKEYVSYKKGNYEVHASYYGNNEKNIIFDIEVVNSKGVDFLVAPEDIKLYAGHWDNVSQNVIYDNIPIHAIDPEAELLKIDMDNSRAEASRKNSQIAAVAIFAAAIPLAIVASNTDIKNSNSGNSNNSVNNTDLVEAGVDLALGATAINQMGTENQIISLNDNRNTWETASLRKTTLSPGYSIRGMVYFPVPDLGTRKIQFDVPTPDGIISFKYDFILYYPQ